MCVCFTELALYAGRGTEGEFCRPYLPDPCECGGGQPGLEEDISDFWSGNKAIHVTVCLVE